MILKNRRWASRLLVGMGLFAGLAGGCSESSNPPNTVDPATGGRIDPKTGKPTFNNDTVLQKNAGGQAIPAAPKMPASFKGKVGAKLEK